MYYTVKMRMKKSLGDFLEIWTAHGIWVLTQCAPLWIMTPAGGTYIHPCTSYFYLRYEQISKCELILWPSAGINITVSVDSIHMMLSVLTSHMNEVLNRIIFTLLTTTSSVLDKLKNYEVNGNDLLDFWQSLITFVHYFIGGGCACKRLSINTLLLTGAV